MANTDAIEDDKFLVVISTIKIPLSEFSLSFAQAPDPVDKTSTK